MRLLLIRHGATPETTENKFSGSSGVELSDQGREQVRKLALRLREDVIAAVYSSPLDRAAESAALVAAPHQLTPIHRDGLREIDHGHWEGLTRADVEARFPGEYETWEADPFTYAPEGGESGVAVLARSLPVIREIVVKHMNECVAVVSHKATLRLLISSLLGFDARGYRDRLDQSPACLNILEFKDPVRARLMLFNDTSHYQGAPRLTEFDLSKWWDAPQKQC